MVVLVEDDERSSSTNCKKYINYGIMSQHSKIMKYEEFANEIINQPSLECMKIIRK